ncbi:DNA oxidative demethylase ALKBH2-like isoform X1 [Schistocerca nitens]|uniref:DNA oxidative demethylase ALKBH2-like isoform X1 n=1 Tax=Schistocerca nitens TaxID=7011 RepID=UPI00211869BE|nr:DNA oxidative demethylase ALKBH2-like isoform X1 [Schistocerca nitens]
MATPAASHPALMQKDGEASKLYRELEQLAGARPSWRKVTAEGLDVDYTRLLTPALADAVLHELEAGLTYFTGDLARVRVFGRWHPIPRQQVAFGDAGLSYKFSGQTLPASPWPPLLLGMRDALSALTGVRFNFVLVNRYRDGNDHMGEHRDDEADLDAGAPIASLSLGAERPFVFKHRDARRRGPQHRDVPPVKLLLEHGSLLMMNPPTNRLWFHALPRRKSCQQPRINLTFRKMLPQPQPAQRKRSAPTTR